MQKRLQRVVSSLFRSNRRGSILMNAVVLMFVLVLTGGAFIRWASDEAHQARMDLARSQAYYLAQKGAIMTGISDLRSRDITQMSFGEDYEFIYPPGPVDPVGDFMLGQYVDAKLSARNDEFIQDFGEGSSEYIMARRYDVSATGRVEFTGADNEPIVVERSVSLRTQLRTFASYMYLSDIETALPADGSEEDVIWFYTGDTLNGRVHSNDWIGLKGSPVFYGPVTTSQEDFVYNSATPHFEIDPVFNVPEIVFPERIVEVRHAAQVRGLYYDSDNGRWWTQVEGQRGGWRITQWEKGSSLTQPEGELITDDFVAYGRNTVIFVDGDVYVKGDEIREQSTIGSAGNMYLIDNVKYLGVGDNSYPTIPEGSNSILGLISESNVVIADTDPNGKAGGGVQNGNIVITAGIVALNTSFTFEHQNDDIPGSNPPAALQWPHDRTALLFCPTGSPQDYRGYIRLRGAVAQKRRGYVARSNCGRSGYDKSYVYDFRLDTNPPPVYLRSQDNLGRSNFDIIASWDSNPYIGNER